MTTRDGVDDASTGRTFTREDLHEGDDTGVEGSLRPRWLPERRVGPRRHARDPDLLQFPTEAVSRHIGINSSQEIRRNGGTKNGQLELRMLRAMSRNRRARRVLASADCGQ